MKLYSWNMFHRNAKLDRAFEFIKTLDFDVLCLQEVPEKFLSRLATLPYSIVHGIDVDIVGAGTLERLYCVILSKHNIISSHDFVLPAPTWPLRSRLFTFIDVPRGMAKDRKSSCSLGGHRTAENRPYACLLSPPYALVSETGLG